MYKRCIKRMLDIALSFFAIIILSPVFLGLAICVRIGMGTPILFSQRRIGKAPGKTPGDRFFAGDQSPKEMPMRRAVCTI